MRSVPTQAKAAQDQAARDALPKFEKFEDFAAKQELQKSGSSGWVPAAGAESRTHVGLSQGWRHFTHRMNSCQTTL